MRHDKNKQSNEPNSYVLTAQLKHFASLAKWFSVRLWTRWWWAPRCSHDKNRQLNAPYK